MVVQQNEYLLRLLNVTCAHKTTLTLSASWLLAAHGFILWGAELLGSLARWSRGTGTHPALPASASLNLRRIFGWYVMNYIFVSEKLNLKYWVHKNTSCEEETQMLQSLNKHFTNKSPALINRLSDACRTWLRPHFNNLTSIIIRNKPNIPKPERLSFIPRLSVFPNNPPGGAALQPTPGTRVPSHTTSVWTFSWYCVRSHFNFLRMRRLFAAT